MTADTITRTVIQSVIASAAEEMFAILKKTAMSPVIYEVLDVGTGITDADGNLLSSGAGIPTFVGVLDKSVKWILSVHPRDSLREGDMFVTNDPYHGGVTHLNDVVVALPVFADGQLIAWTASIAHWNDIGGLVIGSMSTDATEIFQEGLRLPAVRLCAAGRQLDAVFDIIAANSRLPDFVRGDLWAQIAASRLAARRLVDMVGQYGQAAYRDAVDHLFAEGEARVRSGLAALPHGTFSLTETRDDGTPWSITVTITAERMTVDLRDALDQRAAPYNTTRDGAVIAAQMILKALADPTPAANAGSFRPLEVLTRPGTIFHADGTAPHGYYFEIRIGLYDLLWHCIAQAMPDRLPAGHFSSICGTVVAGHHPDTGRRFTMVEPQMGGWGATAEREGETALYSACHGETFNCPAEIVESRYGLDVLYRCLNPAPASTGRHPGGQGLSMCYGVREKVTLSAGYSRTRQPTWGSAGGGPGGTNRLAIRHADGRMESHAFVSGLSLQPGDRIEIGTANGGAWGAGADG
ncbi:N-methylhydantoinase B [Acetobacter tropicalis NRIC 0312]|uniref:Methylhydantoinase n=1 Tax=Acetobacter tropicalis TaxID=104102 RepID=A0A511FL73_9PROT|nr:hydantoinase B/oxoprolinase family protein [Acetobacter tropicalis]KXV48100.1 hypothetical protein AD944_10770 [Acetobacter tropicalis]GAL97564.1 5-oxoprolinase [Acetobacter tropicalis]GBR67396.1 N-methylhydantoinase B [Acetobacter tropicalis NRIC 0312]GEL49983.1 methylhydantoinase [Acetobacter tropicalis]